MIKKTLSAAFNTLSGKKGLDAMILGHTAYVLGGAAIYTSTPPVFVLAMAALYVAIKSIDRHDEAVHAQVMKNAEATRLEPRLRTH